MSPGARARAPSQALMLACRARALIDGRLAPSIDDVVALARAGAAPPHGAQLRRARRRRHAWRRSSSGSWRRSADGGGGTSHIAPRQLLGPPAAAAGGGRARRRHGGARRARPAPRRHRRDLLAVPAIPARRSRAAHRLARERQIDAALCARDRMGGGAERLAVARRLRLDGLCLGAATLPTKRARADLLALALAALLVRGGERVSLLGTGVARRPAAAPCWTGLALTPRAPGAGAPACPASSRCRAMRQLVLIGDLLAPLDDHSCAGRPLRRDGGSAAICCRCSIRPRRRCPLPAASASKGWSARRRC